MHIHTSDQPVFKIGFGDYTCNWGLHMAGLYETEQERDDIIFGYFQQGYSDGDLQLYCPTERTADDFKSKFLCHCPSCKQDIDDDNHFSILPTKGLYYPEGTFSPWDMDKGLNSFFAESQKKGKRNIRATAEMTWALDDVPGVENLMAYESRLNYFIPGKPWISICMYNVTKFSGDMIMKVLRTHPYTVSGGIISQNPFFVNPDEWLAKNAPQFLTK